VLLTKKAQEPLIKKLKFSFKVSKKFICKKIFKYQKKHFHDYNKKSLLSRKSKQNSLFFFILSSQERWNFFANDSKKWKTFFINKILIINILILCEKQKRKNRIIR
jgi:hypothetical protein